MAAAAVQDSSGRILISKRPEQVHQGGLWEFPGGKLEPGETLRQGLERELLEELGIRVLASEPLIRIHHDYGDRHVLLDVQRVTRYVGEACGLEGQPLRWVHAHAMDPLEFPAADRPIISALRLPGRMLITGADPRQPKVFLSRLRRALDSGIRLVQLRTPGLAEQPFRGLAVAASGLCREYGADLVLNPPDGGDFPTSPDGLHLSARRLCQLRQRPLSLDRLVGASCHDEAELAQAAHLDLDYALLSPVQATASHPGREPLGWQRFAELVEAAGVPVYALGGMRGQDEARARQAGGQGIAAISGLWPD